MELSFKTAKTWKDIKYAQRNSHGKLILTVASSVWCWGDQGMLRSVFGDDLVSNSEIQLPTDLQAATNSYVKGFLEEGLCRSLARGKLLRAHLSRYESFLAATKPKEGVTGLEPLRKIVGNVTGPVPGVMTPVTDEHPVTESVTWAEAVRVSIDIKGDQLWLLLEPDIWIHPRRARSLAEEFLDKRKGDRFNEKFNNLLDSWVQIVLGTAERNSVVHVSLLDGDEGVGNPCFRILNRTAFARKTVA
jgi:hypothetical protein